MVCIYGVFLTGTVFMGWRSGGLLDADYILLEIGRVFRKGSIMIISSLTHTISHEAS